MFDLDSIRIFIVAGFAELMNVLGALLGKQ